MVWSHSVLLAWTLSNALLGAAIVQANGKAEDQGAQNSVKGYMAFLLFSVAGLACELFFPFLCLCIDVLFSSSHSLYRLDDVHGHSVVRWRIETNGGLRYCLFLCTHGRMLGLVFHITVVLFISITTYSRMRHVFFRLEFISFPR